MPRVLAMGTTSTTAFACPRPREAGTGTTENKNESKVEKIGCVPFFLICGHDKMRGELNAIAGASDLFRQNRFIDDAGVFGGGILFFGRNDWPQEVMVFPTFLFFLRWSIVSTASANPFEERVAHRVVAGSSLSSSTSSSSDSLLFSAPVGYVSRRF